MKQTATYIYGKHAISEALKNAPRSLEKILIVPHFADKDIRAAIKEKKIPTVELSGGKLPGGLDREAVHQGIAAVINPAKILVPYKDYIESAAIDDDSLFVILGELSDPQNVGAIIRSAAGFGAQAVLIPEHNQAPLTGTVVKVSAGMTFALPILSVSNINTSVRDLKERGFFIYGLEGDSKDSLFDQTFNSPTAIIVGNEAKGVREKTKQLCDTLLRIPMMERCESYNASVSASLAMGQWAKNHYKKFKN